LAALVSKLESAAF